MKLFDVNAGVGHWPFYPTPATTVHEVEACLREAGIHGACAYALEAYLYPDPQDANERHLPQLAASSFFVPSAVLNPTLPNALDSLTVCRERWNVPFFRLFPSFHQYTLDAPEVDQIASDIERTEGILGVHVRAQDERSQNPIAQVSAVPFEAIVDLACRHPGLPVVALCAYGHEIGRVRRQHGALPDNLYVELSFFETEDPLTDALQSCSLDRLLFGTHTPLFYPLANVYKLSHTQTGTREQEQVFGHNARELLGSWMKGE